jgi:hypothetical protein
MSLRNLECQGQEKIRGCSGIVMRCLEEMILAGTWSEASSEIVYDEA